MSTANQTKLKKKAAEFEQKKQFEKALQLYIQFIDESGKDLDDADLQLYNRVGDLLTRQGNVSESLAYYEKAVDMYAERGFLNNAIALCNKILRQSPTRTAVYYKLGKISANKGFKSDARKNFLEYADRMQKGGQRDEAFRALKEFADLCPDQDDIRLMLADLLSKDSRNGEAIEQLEHLYAKLEAEGREAEARATMERIKAIDPDITPRASGVFQAQKSNDLVFLDLGEAVVRPARPATPVPVTPIAPLPAIETIDVSSVGALQGLAITFLPDESTSDAAVIADAHEIAALDGLDAGVGDGLRTSGEVVAVPGLEADHLELSADEIPPVITSEPEQWAGTGDVDPIPGLTSIDASVTGDQPVVGAIGEEPGVSAVGTDAVHAADDDFGLIGTGEHTGLLEETPDEWVHAALGAPRDDLRLDRLLTPLENQIVSSADALAGLSEPATEPPASFSVDELLQLPAPVLPEFALDGIDDADPVTGSGDDGVVPEGSAVSWSADPIEHVPGAADLVSDTATEESEFGVASEGSAGLWSPSFGDEQETPVTADEAAAGSDDMVEAKMPAGEASEPERLVADAGLSSPEGSAVDAVRPPEFQVEATHTALDESAGVLDLSAVRSALDHHGSATPDDVAEVLNHAFGAEASADGTEPTARDAEEPEVRNAFAEDRVELPLLDLESGAETSTPTFELASTDLDEMLSSSPSFGHDTPTAFEPPPLDLDESIQPVTEEWNAPEVLIDGEWRDEHVGGLVSGEMFVVERRQSDHPIAPLTPFDDLAAAMLYEGNDPGDHDGRRLPTPSSPDAFAVRPYAPRQRVSFGGLEAQLRQRLELDPSDAGLRRQLGEALLDLGDREAALAELEIAIREYELRGDLAGAREATDVILRVVPLSVRHHQKKVEYAARTNDRPKLVDAYTALGESLFRCGEPDKARVVYTRVLELNPSSEAARFALGMLSQHVPLSRSSDEIPSIDTGILSRTPSVVLVTLTPDAIEAVIAEDNEPADLPYLPLSPLTAAPVDAMAGDALDEEVDAAFADEAATAREIKRRTAELDAIAEWAADQPPAQAAEGAQPSLPDASDDTFVDLGSWLRGEDAPRSTRMVTTDVAPTGDEGADFAEMLRRFKQGVAESVEDEDFASHYDLGVAFKEMGLLDEAISQFQKALRGPDHRVRAYESLGQCFVDKGQFDVARALLARALEIPQADDMTLVGVLYLLGIASERSGLQADAVGYYQRVFAVDISFRDVTQRLAALEHRTS